MADEHKDLISLLDYSPEEIQHIIDSARDLKRNRLARTTDVMKGKTGVLIFEKPSLRTRITFEVAINELGGFPITLTNDMVGIGKRETVEDVARNLSRWVHLIVARTFSHDTVLQLAHHSTIPVINALTDSYHPCQALAFTMTMQETRGQGKDHRIVFVGDGNNVCMSLMVIAAQLGYAFTCVCPKGYAPLPQVVRQCREIAHKSGGSITISHDLHDAVRHASFIYTDVWTSMGQEPERERRKNDFAAFQVNHELLAHAPSDVLVSHCLPAHRGEEITSEVLDSPASIALEEAENRLHVQKAAIVHLFS